MKVLILTSSCLRHSFFARELIERCNILGYKVKCVIEAKDYESTEKECKEICFYKNTRSIESRHLLTMCAQGQINSKDIKKNILDYDPDIGFVFGTSILSSEVFDIPRLGCYNLHTGLVQYYRGVDSTSWPLIHREYERIGFTVHKVIKGIDSGEVALQECISPVDFYDPYDLFLHVCKEGTVLLVEKLSQICKNKAKLLSIEPAGKLYRKKDSFSDMEKVARQNLYELNTRK